MSLTIVQTQDRNIQQIQQNVAQVLNPLLSNLVLSGVPITSVALKVGTNTIAHGLNKTLTGWFLTRVRAQSNVWDSQDSNPNKSTTLILNASAAVTVDLYVF